MKNLLFAAAIVLLSSTSFVMGGMYGPKLVGGPGYLQGWTITHDGEEICDDPYVWDASKEIECD
jgi:hypothetical protein